MYSMYMCLHQGLSKLLWAPNPFHCGFWVELLCCY